MRPFLLLLPALLTTACNDAAGEAGVSREAPPAAAVLAPGVESESLMEQLSDLATELDAALEGEPNRLLRAEAISDRLIHAERPSDWLATGYDVEARLRQLQAMADRVVAMLRRGASLASVEEEIVDMRRSVADLQTRLATTGGGAAPPTLDSLLAQDPLRDVQAASLSPLVGDQESADTARDPLPDIDPQVGPVRSAPLGTPLPDPPDTIPNR